MSEPITINQNSTRRIYCDDCCVYVEIKLEPNVDPKEITCCPFCGGDEIESGD